MVVFGKLELKRKGRRKTGSNIATCQRRDAWSTEKSQQVTQRRDASTSRRLNIAKLQYHDVATSRRHRDFCLRIIKSNGDLISRNRRKYGLERGK